MLVCRLIVACIAVILATPPIHAQKLEPTQTPNPPAKTVQTPTPEAIKAANLFEQGVKQQRAGKADEAIKTYRELVKIAPAAFPAYVNLGMLLAGRKDYKGAEAAFKSAARIEPKESLPVIQLGTIYLDQHKLPDAKAAIDKAVALAPKSPQAHFLLGGYHTASGKPAAAEKEYREAVRLAPNNAHGHYNLGSVLAMQNRSAEAIASYQRAAQLDPKMGQAYLLIGALRQNRKEYTEAIKAYRRAAELIPTNPSVWLDLGNCYRTLSKDARDPAMTQDAIAAYRKAVERAPKLMPARVNLARLLFQSQKYPEAAVQFREALALDPKNTGLLVDTALAETWEAMSDTNPLHKKEIQQTAEARFIRAIAAKDTPVQAYTGLAAVYESQGLRDKAVETYAKISTRFPKEPFAQIAIARIKETQGLLPAAHAAYEQALKIDPKNVPAMIALARLEERQSLAPQAEARYKQAVAADPKNVEAHRQLGQFYLTHKRSAEATAEFEAIKRFAPKENAPYIALGSAYERENKQKEALAEYKELVAKNPDDVSGHWYAARVLEQMGKIDDAIAQYLEIERIQPADNFYAVNIARLRELQGKPEAALAEYRRLRDKHPKDMNIRTQYANLLDKLKRWTEAIPELQAIAAIDPRATWAMVRVGADYEQLGKLNEARTAYMRALSGSESSYDAYSALGRLYDKEGRLEPWMAFLKARIREKPGNSVALTMLEAAANKLNKKDDILAFYKDLTEPNAPGIKDSVFLVYFARLLDRENRPAEALDMYRKAAAAAPSDFAVRALIAGRLEQSDRLPDAIAVYEDITHISGVPPAQMTGYRLRLAGLYEKNGQKNVALDHYRAALKIDPTNATAKDGVKRLGG